MLANRLPVAILISVSAVLFSCSLSSIKPVRTIQIALPEKLRDEPLLSQMTQFAIVVSGGVANTLSPSQLGNRSLDCVNLVGQVFFPFTLAQLTSGVGVALSQGDYRFSIVAFANGMGSPTTVAQLYSGSPSLKSYLVAQAQVNTATSSSATLTSTYNPAAALDLFVSCPPGNVGYHGLFIVSDFLQVFQRDGGAWGYSTLASYSSKPNIFVDSTGVVHISYSGFHVSNQALQYVTNSTGTYQSELVAATDGTGSTAIAQTTNGNLYAVSALSVSDPDLRVWRRISAGNWTLEGVGMGVGSSVYTRTILKSGPANALLLAADYDGNTVYVANNQSGGPFSGPFAITSADSYNCVTGSDMVAGVIDPVGYSHVVFRCLTAPLTGRLGYANNVSGSWTTFDLGAATTTDMTAVSIDIDAGGLLHAAYSDGYLVHYLKGSSVTGIWVPATTVYQTELTDRVLGVALAAKSANDVQLVVNVQISASQNYLIPVSNRTGSWVADSSFYDNSTGIALVSTLTSR